MSRAEQTPIVLISQMGRAVTAQLLQVGPVVIDEMQHQQPTEHEVVPVVKTGPQHPQTLGDAAGQAG
jgi:hypothetical protein